jgi:hypothetical protein
MAGTASDTICWQYVLSLLPRQIWRVLIGKLWGKVGLKTVGQSWLGVYVQSNRSSRASFYFYYFYFILFFFWWKTLAFILMEQK